MKLTEEEMWEAVVHNNRDYDGRLFYAVKSTGIVCRPSCKSKLPLRKNVTFFSKITEAYKKGYRTCKRCRPDLLLHPSEQDTIDLAVSIMKDDFMNDVSLHSLAKRVGMSPYHFHRLFKTIVGVSPNAFLTAYRMKKGSDLLRNTNLTITMIASKVGYPNPSYFSSSFHKQFLCSPSEYRRLENKKEKENEA